MTRNKFCSPVRMPWLASATSAKGTPFRRRRPSKLLAVPGRRSTGASGFRKPHTVPAYTKWFGLRAKCFSQLKPPRFHELIHSDHPGFAAACARLSPNAQENYTNVRSSREDLLGPKINHLLKPRAL